MCDTLNSVPRHPNNLTGRFFTAILASFLPAVFLLAGPPPLAARGTTPDEPGINQDPGPSRTPAAGETLAPSVKPGRDGELQRSKSSSGQFVVYGDRLDLRGQFCVFSENIKADLHALLGTGEDSHWSSPIVIRIATGDSGGRAPADRSVLTVVRPYDFGGWLLQLEVFLEAADFSREELEEEIIRLLLAERILHNAEPEMIERRQRRILPDWLHQGIVGVIRYRREGRPSDTFHAVWKAGNPLDIDEILEGEHDRLDGLSRRVFEASATGLVYALHRQRQGRLCLRQMIGELGRNELDQRKRLAKHFPELNTTRDAIEKWWTLEMASLAEGSAFESLSAEQTEARLANTLEITFTSSGQPEKRTGLLAGLLRRNRPAPEEDTSLQPTPETSDRRTIELRQLAELKNHPRRETILLAKADELIALELRCFPLYQPIVSGYTEIVSTASQGKRVKDLETRLDKLEAQRRATLMLTRRTEHFLDYIEATQTRHISSDFDDYLRLMESFQRPFPPRPDPISRYLDAIENEWR